MGNISRSKLRTATGARRPKQKPRGISKLRQLDPSIPDPLAPHRIKKGQVLNPSGRSGKIRVSEAVIDELEQIDPRTGITEAAAIAKGLINRAKSDSTEIERVLRITEPELAGNFSSATGLSIQTEDVSVVFGRLLSKD
jgi:hypothetical protein